MTETPVTFGFDLTPRLIPLSDLRPRKAITPTLLKRKKYAAILASIQEIGLVEMPLVYPTSPGVYDILDGHMRIEALRTLGINEVFCLVSRDDEAFSSVIHVVHLTPIQEHYMIATAVSNGVSEERIARSLRVDVKRIHDKRDLLRDVCDEAIQLLDATSVSAQTIRELRRVVPERQVEIAEAMIRAGNFTLGFCRGLVLASKPHLLSEAFRLQQEKAQKAVDYTALLKMQDELESLQRQLQVYEDTYGQNFLNLVVVRGYLAKLVGNARVTQLLETRYPDLYTAIRHIVDSVSLEG
ncbi:MAG: RepB plasmid partitioning protein [bacterium ADurb.Bin429]|nr:MAG: RepB plasmid partitioning protein [bacterium ADurb.Bin429]